MREGSREGDIGGEEIEREGNGKGSVRGGDEWRGTLESER